MKSINEKLKKYKKLKILIIRLKPIGDTILISPVFRNLKKLFPNVCIEVIIYPFVYDVIKNNPHVDKITILKRSNLHKLIFYIKSFFKHYHVIIDYINNPTSTLISLFSHSKYRIGCRTSRNFFYNYRIKFKKEEYSSIRCIKLLEPLGLQKFDDYMPEFFEDEKDKNTIKNLWIGLKIPDKIIGIFVSAKYPSKQYISKYFADLAEIIIKKTDYNVLFLFGKDDNKSFFTIQKRLLSNNKVYFISPNISIGELGCIISKCNYFITNDAGPKHIATAVNIPTLTIFSATNEKVWNPPDFKKFPIIRNKTKCSPCDKKNCITGTFECMSELKPEEIFKNFFKLIK